MKDQHPKDLLICLKIKILMVRKNNNGRNTTTDNRKESNSFALFGNNITSSTNNNNIDLFSKAVKKTKESCVVEQIGSQHVNEKSKSSEHSVKEVGYQAKRGFRSLKIYKDHIGSESDSIDTKGQGYSKIKGGDKSSGTESRKLKTKDNRSVSKVGRNKQKIQKIEGGAGVHENDNSNSKVENVDFRKYPIGEFDVTDKIQNYSIQGQPRIIDDFTCEVIIDGKRYKVSPWSIKGGQYIQGLDSIFLVSKYNVGKHK